MTVYRMVGIFYMKIARVCGENIPILHCTIFVTVSTEVSEVALTNEFNYSIITLYKLLKENLVWKSSLYRAGANAPFAPQIIRPCF